MAGKTLWLVLEGKVNIPQLNEIYHLRSTSINLPPKVFQGAIMALLRDNRLSQHAYETQVFWDPEFGFQPMQH